MLTDVKSKLSPVSILKFLVPSILGVFIFMTPVMSKDGITIPVAIMSNAVQSIFADILPAVTVALICISAIGSIITKLVKPKFITEHKFLNNLFNVTPLWFVVRLVGAAIGVMVLFKVGPEFIWSENTGGMVLFGLLPILFSVFLFAGLFLPLLLNFGLLEFFGTLLTKVMRPIFKLPGRSSVDCIASWLGDGTIGVLLTSKQYEDGFYSQREACVIGTTFSFVSITFSLVVISTVGLGHMFVPFYLTTLIAGIVAAIIVPRIRPLSKKPDSYYGGKKNHVSETIPDGHSSFSWGLNQAVVRAEKSSDFKSTAFEAVQNVMDMWLGVMPVVMAVGGIALMIAEYTPIFKILGLPFIPLLNLLQIPEAVAASQTLVVGFADMLLPSVIAANITSEMTRFIIAAVSVTQLIYLSEVGGLLLGSKIPVSLKDMIIIFLERTIITLPVITLIANIIF